MKKVVSLQRQRNNSLVMLLRFSVSNFLSFYEKVVFDMFPNPNRVRFPEHIYQHEIPLLKESAIYGPNGSGKSNFIKAVGFLKLFLTEKDYLHKVDLNRCRYRLTGANDKPIVFETEFTTHGKYYLYTVRIGKSLSEELYLSGIGKKDDILLFRRDGSRLDSEHMDNQASAEKLLSMNPKSSVLPLNSEFPIFNSEDVTIAYQWFKEKVEVVDITSKIPVLIHMMARNPKLLKFASDMLTSCDLNINGFSIQEHTFEEWIVKHRDVQVEGIIEKHLKDVGSGLEFGHDMRNEFNVYKDTDGTRKVQEFAFNQFGVGGYEGVMDILSQSDGTVRMLTLIPAFYDALFNEKTVFVDEIENSMHPNLIYEMVKYYSSKRSNGQLIYTTHLSKLMDQQNLLRLDEYWIVRKEDGQTKMRSMSDFNIHNTIKIENGYLQGRYGGVPQVNLEIEDV